MCRKYRNTEIFKKEVHDLYGKQLDVTGEFTNMRTKIEMYCNIHNETFSKEPDKIINRNQHCKKCGRKRIAKSRKIKHDDFSNKFHLHRNPLEFTLLSDYQGDREVITIYHTVCNETYTTTPLSIWNSKGCPICNDKRKNTDEFKAEVFDLIKNEYEVLSEYINCYTYINMKHVKCGHKWEVIPNSFLQGSRCPKCRESRSEKEMLKYFGVNNIKVFNQYRFRDCRNILPLPFDFTIFSNKKELVLNIEYDGEQHFESIEFFGGIKDFEYRIKNDEIKNQYCIKNNTPLIRIPYTQQKNIEYILHNVLIHFGLIENKQDTYDKDIVLKYLVDSNWDHEKYIEENKAS